MQTNIKYGINFRAELLSKLSESSTAASQDLISLMLIGRRHILSKMQSTPLFAASIIDRFDMLEILIHSVPIINGGWTGHIDEPSGGYTALHGAAQYGCYESARTLISMGADINRGAEHDGTTPIHAAAREGNFRMVRLLIDSGAHVDSSKAPAWNSPLYAASLCLSVFNELPRFVAVSRMLLDAGAAVDTLSVCSSHVLTPLGNAVTHGNIEMVDLLLDHGASAMLADRTMCATDRRSLARIVAERSKQSAAIAELEARFILETELAEAAAVELLAMEAAEKVKSLIRAGARQRKRDKKRRTRPLQPSDIPRKLFQDLELSPRSAPIGIPVSKLFPTSHGSDRDDEWDDECVACLDRRRTCMLLPCSHIVMCLDCAVQMLDRCDAHGCEASCPICRVPTTCLVDMC